MTTNTVNKYKHEKQPYITYEEAANVLGIQSQSITSFANENGVTRGQTMIRGRMRGVLKTDEFYSVVKKKNYFNDQPVEVNWNGE